MNDLANNKPKISIIIPSYNQGKTIEASILSVLNQSYSNIELIIIDGKSKDNTIEILHKYNSQITYWISEKDQGIYDAMNKGIKEAKGEWIFFLGTDDIILPRALSKIASYLNEKYKVVFGAVIFDFGHIHNSFLNIRTNLQNTVHHQSAFYRRDLFDNFEYDTTLKAMSDYELNLKIYRGTYSYFHLKDLVVSECASSGISSNLDLSLKETNLIRGKYLTPFSNRIYSLILSLYYLQKKIRNIIK